MANAFSFEPDADFAPWRGTPLEDTATEPDFTHEETFRLALESIERWGGNYRLSPALRLRAIRAVVTSALQSDGA